MRRKKIKDRCSKRHLPKFVDVCKTYDAKESSLRRAKELAQGEILEIVNSI